MKNQFLIWEFSKNTATGIFPNPFFQRKIFWLSPVHTTTQHSCWAREQGLGALDPGTHCRWLLLWCMTTPPPRIFPVKSCDQEIRRTINTNVEFQQQSVTRTSREIHFSLTLQQSRPVVERFGHPGVTETVYILRNRQHPLIQDTNLLEFTLWRNCAPKVSAEVSTAQFYNPTTEMIQENSFCIPSCL